MKNIEKKRIILLVNKYIYKIFHMANKIRKNINIY